MGRWQPDARGRLARAALELYAQRGYEQTTVADIAQHAGVTERTFFRYFADKREVLFDSSNALQQLAIDAIESTPPDTPAVDTVGAAMISAASMLEDRREYARQRAAAIAANANLQERELLKLATLATAVAEALRHRGVTEPAASLAADAGLTVFRVGFEMWIDDDSQSSLATSIRTALDQLAILMSGR